MVVAWSAVSKFMESADTCYVAGVDLCKGFGSLLHILLALGCRCVAVCVERCPSSLSAISANLEFVDKLDPEAFVGVLSRRSFNLMLVGDVRRVKADTEHRCNRSCASLKSVGLPDESCLRVNMSTEKRMCPCRIVPG